MPNRREFLGGALAAGGVSGAPIAVYAGWTRSVGGWGGAVLRVTTLAGAGEGSLRAALAARGPRTIVFDVGGVIDLGLERLDIDEPHVTIAGETAPEPGITLIRGGFWVTAHDVIVRHIAVRPGTAGQSRGWAPDGLTAYGAHDVVVDQCSFSWGVDENLSASGKRFLGADLEAWRRNTSHRITFSNNIVAEALSHATHEEGEHSKGTLIHDNCTEVLIYRNLYAHNRERHPLAKGGSQSAIVNNVFVNPGNRCAQYNLVAREWEGRPPVPGAMALVGNVMRGGADTAPDLPMLMVGGAGDLELFETGNIATYANGSAAPIVGYSNTGRPEIRRGRIREPWPPGPIAAAPAAEIEASIYAQCGMRPWARNAIDARILREARAGRGRIIDSEDEVGGYPA